MDTLLLPVLTLACGEAVFRFLIEESDDEGKRKIASAGLCITVIGVALGCLFIAVTVPMQPVIKAAFIFYMVAEIANNYFLSFARGVKKLKLYAIAGIVMMLTSALLCFFAWLRSRGRRESAKASKAIRVRPFCRNAPKLSFLIGRILP